MSPDAADTANLRNALDLIYRLASLHYIGGAFDPEHMRGLANIAADALAGKTVPPPPERDEKWVQAVSETWLGYQQFVD